MTHSQTVLRWQRDAACLDHPQDWWFPHKGCRASQRAKRICCACLVRHECLVYAMSGNEDHGIWGGFGVREIDEYKRARCRVCRRSIPVAEAATLAIRGMAVSEWCCRSCWYRQIQQRKRA